MTTIESITLKFKLLTPHLGERAFRLSLAAEAMSRGRGGVSEVAKAVGISRTTIHAGIHELQSSGGSEPPLLEPSDRKIRKPGAGRKRIKECNEKLVYDLDRLVDPVTRGDPMSPLRWTCKSTTKLTEELRGMGHSVSQSTVWRLLDELGYSMQSNQKKR